MIDALTAAVVAIAVVVVIDFLLSLAIIRRLRIQGSLGRPEIELPRVGMSIPTFNKESITGDEIDADWIRRQRAALLGFFASSCPACSRLKDDLRKHPPNVPFVAFLRDSQDLEVVDPELRDVLGSLGHVVPFDASTGLTREFDVSAFPTLIRVEDGIVVAAGHNLRAIESQGDRPRDGVAHVFTYS